MNIHPGESWEDVFRAVAQHATLIGKRVADGNPFGLGLRLSARAVKELSKRENLSRFKDYLDKHNLYIFTLNGFPYGMFHGRPVKAEVYRPDWTHPARLAYTRNLADILSGLLPEGVTGSISTVPGSYRDWIKTDAEVERMAFHLLMAVRHMADILRQTGKEMHLGIEPEPDCYIASIGDFIRFFNEQLLPRTNSPDDKCRVSEEVLRRHLGICLDTCHAAVMFEDPVVSIQHLRAEGIRLSKVQLSAGLEVDGRHRDVLADFDEPVYLHQTGHRTPNGIVHHPDLPQALAAPATPGDIFRVHFHVPLHWDGTPPLKTTSVAKNSESQKHVSLFSLLAAGATEHLEIETYSFEVLPESLRTSSVDESIIAEIEWTKARLTCCNAAL